MGEKLNRALLGIRVPECSIAAGLRGYDSPSATENSSCSELKPRANSTGKQNVCVFFGFGLSSFFVFFCKKENDNEYAFKKLYL